ncbi:MAG: hypothetical protein A3J46_06525 [Candidatus Yanofskybacteria bacterium RIFCSPHIGHO2_02_FULL_41_11]|uniref:peptidoglycan glycosyltransferase n=1 Tax=Candidatus Yanofskybacteria bacterium RIFCSPHIGHO2_02_FULL_41_11 TaxID=1802675 RepID=A0A1F8F8V5_9BACT|nr:MAG: hypothetical protein A3J46_06525 [Candidatus Yanofskybacteria bacterium RIFCSPHIGHO2_02_FULL_41_11]
MKGPPDKRFERLKKLANKLGLDLVKKRPWWQKYVVLLIAVASIFGCYYYAFQYTGDLRYGDNSRINFKNINSSAIKRASYIYDSSGQVTGRFYDEIRDTVKLSEIPLLLRNGFIAAEDQRFYRGLFWGIIPHPGIDPIAITRAGFGNVLRQLGFKYLNKSGASSITQQFTRLILAEEISEFKNRDQTFARKIKEAKIAIQVEKQYTKDKILEDFLNLIYFGHGVNGIAEAAQRYFGKDIRTQELNLREIAILVSLNKSPSGYCPIFHGPKGDPAETVRIVKARERYNWVLSRMLEDGYITQKEFQEAMFKEDEPLEAEIAKLNPIKKPVFGYSNRMVKEMLLTSGYSENELSRSKGLRVYTTIDPKIQRIASEEFEKHLALLNEEKAGGNKINGAFVIIDVKTGDIKAISGGNNFDETQYNRALASRSPGSGFKPFVYAAAMEQGMGYYDKVCNCPLDLSGGAKGERWRPQNFKEKNPQPTGYIDLARGIIWSLNLETLNLARSIGMESVVQEANSMGVWGNRGLVRDSSGEVWFRRPGYEVKEGLIPLLPTAIGASEVNLIEIANAYAVFARGGIYMKPNLTREVRDSYGEIIHKPELSYQERVLSQETADSMTALMRAVTKIGTAKISMRDIEQQVAVKTGTSDGPRDLGMYGFTPELALVIRVGHDNYGVVELPEYMKKVSGDSEMQISGGWVVGPLFRKIIDRIHEDRTKVAFSEDVESKLSELLERYN